MSQKWKTIRIFISSTFRDMHAERDHLVRFVFPELKQKCRERRVHLIDVDLRWGVSEQDTQDGKALDICLDEIDSCRPYFIGLLGHRYGWTPPGQEHSITAQEIYHGVLHNDIPRQIVDLRQIIDGRLEGKALTDEQINCLGRCYQWDADKGKYLLRQNTSSDDLNIIRSIFQNYSAYQKDRSFFFFRSETLSRELAGTNINDFFEPDDVGKDKLTSLKQEIIDDGLPCIGYDDIESFGRQVEAVLWKRIESEIEHPLQEDRGWFEEEAEFHELFMADRTRRFVGRRFFLDRMYAFCEGKSETSIMVITGEPGCGKSALMARFIQDIHNHSDLLIIPHFVGVSPNSTNLRQTLKRFCTFLNQAITPHTMGIPEDIKELIQVFQKLIDKASKGHKILFIVDALNQLEKTDNAHGMLWLPQQLPENVKFVISTLAGDCLDALMSRRIKPKIESVNGLNEDDIRELVKDYLAEIRREFPNKEVEENFLNKVTGGNPLYIQVALEELRIFGKFEELAIRVEEFPDNVPDLFMQVLERIETDFNPALVRDCLSYIACGRNGMTTEELQTLLKAHAPQAESKRPPEKLPDMIWARLLRSFSAYLLQRSGVIDYFHGQLKEAVDHRYFKEEKDQKSTHKTIADYFETRWREPYFRALDELPYQRIKAEDWDLLEPILTDLRFIGTKCAAGMTYDLVADYNIAFDDLPEAQEEIQKERKYQDRVKKYTKDLISYAKGKIQQIDIIPSVEPWSMQEIRENIEKVQHSSTRLVRLRAFSQFVDNESSNLVNFGTMPGFCIQQAINFSGSSIVSRSAKKLLDLSLSRYCFLISQRSLTTENLYPAIIKVLGEYKRNDPAISMTPDGRLAVSRTGREICVWQLGTGQCVNRFEGPDHFRINMSITGDGALLIISTHEDLSSDIGFLSVWDLYRSELLRIIDTRFGPILAMSVTPDGRLVFCLSMHNSYQILHVWDLETGNRVKAFITTSDISDPNGPFYSISVTPNAKLAVSACLENFLRVWDLETGEYKKLIGHTKEVWHTALTPDGRIAASSSQDKTIRVWEIENMNCLATFRDETIPNPFPIVKITHDGKYVISGRGDNAIQVWDIINGSLHKSLEAPFDYLNALEISADGRRAISVSDRNMLVWDIERGSFKEEDIWQWDFQPDSYEALIGKHNSIVTGLCIAPNNKFIVSASWDGYLLLWDLENGKCIKTFKGHEGPIEALAMASNEQTIVSGGGNLDADDFTLRVWDTENSCCFQELEGHTNAIISVHITPDDSRIISASEDDTVRVWNIENGHCLHILECGGPLKKIYLTVDARLSISLGEHSDIEIWDLETREQRIFNHPDYVYDIILTPDGKLMGTTQDTLFVWDIQSSKSLKTIDTPSNFGRIFSVTPDGHQAILVFGNKNIQICNLKTGEFTLTLGHSRNIETLCISQDGHHVFSASEDGAIRLWDMFSGRCICLAVFSDAISSLEYKGQILAVGHYGGKVNILKTKNLNFQVPIVTPFRLYRNAMNSWDKRISAVCKWCGQLFSVDKVILSILAGIARDNDLSPSQSPCLELPDGVWSDPNLFSECPDCHKPLKFNPFIVDNRDRY